MSAEIKNENIFFILPEDLEILKKKRNTPDIEEAIKNIEKLQRLELVDNTLDFIEIEVESMEIAIKEQSLDVVFRLLPVFLSDVKRLLRKVKK